MKKEPVEKILYAITEDTVQERAQESILRYLTNKELSEVGDALYENNWHIDMMIDESIASVIDLDNLLKRNKRAKDLPIKYIVYWKNENAYQKNFVEVFSGLTEKDAREYIKLDSVCRCLDDEYRIAKLDRNTETEIAVIHLPLEESLF